MGSVNSIKYINFVNLISLIIKCNFNSFKKFHLVDWVHLTISSRII
jgi:hypothetical protein